ncbi:MAG: SCP2 sterol-binding domain-containing protein [Candidatus Schekmanbacteria bacterium]|nr:SCP2 sterol-binding domain-containing protein [Candidatus Schekmanbacteria bacterium]
MSDIAIPVTVDDIFGTMEKRVNPDGIAGVSARYGYEITGEGGGTWTVAVDKGKVAVTRGLESVNVKSIISASDFIALNLGKLDGMTAFTTGRLRVEGDMALMLKAPRFFKKYVPPAPAGVAAEAPRAELVVLRQILSIPQRFATGPIMGKFLSALKERKILAIRCSRCGKRLLPAREVCADCVAPATDWVEVGPGGKLTMYDITYYASPDPLTGESRETPYVSAHILLDGCEGQETFWHEVNPDHIPRMHPGARVWPVWNEQRRGAITDIRHFDVVDENDTAEGVAL